VTSAVDLLRLVPAFLVVALGTWIALLRPRRGGHVAFFAYTTTIGITTFYFVLAGASAARPEEAAWQAVRAALNFSGAGALVALALTLPEPVRREDRRPLLLAATVAGAYFAVMGGVLVLRPAAALGAGFPVTPWYVAADLGMHAIFATFSGTLVLLALRWLASQAHEAALRARFALFAAAIGVSATASWIADLDHAAPLERAAGFVGGGVALAVAALFLAGGARGREPRQARSVAWILLGTALATLLLDGLFPISIVSQSTMLVLVAYGIAKKQLLGLDVKVRWTISKSTVAAAFIAAFFVASEGAQIILGQENQWIGLLGAGALVFVLAPLQRAAERLAEKAVPVASPAATTSMEGSVVDRRLAAYRRAYAMAWANGQCTQKEMRMLVALRDELGLTADEIHTVERESHAAGAGGGAG